MKGLQKHKEYNDLLNLFEFKMNETPIELPLKHIFTPGVYMREMLIPKDVCLTSKVHLTEHPYIVSMGVINILTKNEIVRVVAPYTGINKKGTRRMGYALEDTIFTSIHPNPDDCRDIDVLEARLFKKYNNPLLKGLKNKELV